MTNRKFEEYCERLRAQHGEKFTRDGLATKFAPFFGQRIEVRFNCGTVKRGFVTGTTGWRPSLMLLLRRNSSGSSWLLGTEDTITQTFQEFR